MHMHDTMMGMTDFSFLQQQNTLGIRSRYLFLPCLAQAQARGLSMSMSMSLSRPSPSQLYVRFRFPFPFFRIPAPACILTYISDIPGMMIQCL